jgi:ABC-2 type transport system permease protein
MNWWASVVSMEFRKILAYRSDFWVTFIGQTLIQLTIARALWQNVFEVQGRSEMQGFTLEMMTLYYLIVAIGGRVLTGENIGFISREIYEGTFSRYLIYPLSVFQYKTLTYLTHSSFYALQLLLVFGAYQLAFVDGTIAAEELLRLLVGTLLFLICALVYVLMAMVIELLALWADNIWSLVVMLRFFTNFFGGGFIPLDFFPAWARGALEFTPFPLLISLPVKTIMGLVSWAEIGAGILVLGLWGAVFAGLVSVIWARGQKQYTGVGI